ncbi:Ada metal-binding domain-containing protein [Dyadobacter psychrotolerans]|uniref:Metal-binding protein n=1 Tax=Dyadobacter psychrotolerans TaxID=2541721 RepID=A0A4R5DC80_9BACT|nr:Ada metal-binding domain-containing protein [Dyadobacter psychrotolerans]TDE11299.1 metal-binding protein [Dyadobacter psychrotolerans]
MIKHVDLGKSKSCRKSKLASLIRHGEVRLAGYSKGKIYGLLSCSSGKRMKIENRVFFRDEDEALANDYRPCGNCLKDKYSIWKNQ